MSVKLDQLFTLFFENSFINIEKLNYENLILYLPNHYRFADIQNKVVLPDCNMQSKNVSESISVSLFAWMMHQRSLVLKQAIFRITEAETLFCKCFDL